MIGTSVQLRADVCGAVAARAAGAIRSRPARAASAFFCSSLHITVSMTIAELRAVASAAARHAPIEGTNIIRYPPRVVAPKVAPLIVTVIA